MSGTPLGIARCDSTKGTAGGACSSGRITAYRRIGLIRLVEPAEWHPKDAQSFTHALVGSTQSSNQRRYTPGSYVSALPTSRVTIDNEGFPPVRSVHRRSPAPRRHRFPQDRTVALKRDEMGAGGQRGCGKRIPAGLGHDFDR